MTLELVAKAMKELGHITRLTIFKRVVKVGHKGIPMGQLQQELAVPGSTLSHHVSALVNAGLLAQRREGRTLFCVAQYNTLAEVISFLETECCIDETNN